MQKENKGSIDLTRGAIPGGILAFAIPLFLGQLLQQLYNMVDAWVIGNFADNDAFAAVSSTGTVVFLIIGFFSGIATGGGVVISRYFGARDEDNVSKAVHTNFLMGLIASAIGTVAGLILAPHLLVWLGTPDSVMPHALRYLQIYFGGVSTVILFHCEYRSGSAFCGPSCLSLGCYRCCSRHCDLSGSQRHSLFVSYVSD